MKNYLILLFLPIAFFSSISFAGYDCHELVDDSGKLGPKVVKIDDLDKDSDVISTLWDILNYRGASFVKYQFWVDVGDGYNMVHFSGISDKLLDGAPELKTINLFCKNDGFIEEGGLD